MLNLNQLFDKAMGFLKRPDQAYSKERKTELMDAFLYMVVLSVVTAVLSGLLSLAFAGPLLAVLAIVATYIGGIVFSVIAGLWLHLWAYIFGAKKGLNQTLKATFFGGTPSYLLGWIPIVNILAWLWSLYIQWTGLKSLQAMPGDRAAYSMVIAFIIPALVVAVLAVLAMSLFMPFMPGSGFGDLPPGFMP